MNSDLVLLEAKRLYEEGFAIHWLHSKSKRPVESGWTTGPRASWDYLEKTYRKGLNVGVRLGAPSKIKNNFLAVIDVDVKSSEERHGQEIKDKIGALVGTTNLPVVSSGRGNGSRHYYILTPTPVKPFLALRSKDQVKVSMPSVQPSKREMRSLTLVEIESGVRLRPAWEISVMGDGQQVVLPPSIHPDSGKNYKWQTGFDWSLAKNFDFKNLVPSEPNVENSVDVVEKSGPKTLDNFIAEDIDMAWLPISDKIRNMITTGEGVEDRSAMLLPVSIALHRSGLSQNEILSILTDPNNYLGSVAYEHAKTKDRTRAARWLYRYTLEKVIHQNNGETLFANEFIEPVKLSPKEMEAEQERFDDANDWRNLLERTKELKLKPSLQNVVLILQNIVAEDVFKKDTFAYREFYSMATPWGGVEGKSIVDGDLISIKYWLSTNFGFEPNSNTLGEAVSFIANENSFDPVVEMLEALPPWDNVERLDSWLVDHFGAQGDAEYLGQVFRKWLCAMVLRTYQPGTKFDWMPIFEGNQGVGKSSFGRLLCGEKYFLDWLPDLTNKDSALALQGIWAVEMGELAQFRKNEIESVKAFITRTIDKVRPPYGERWLETPRRCVFFGTTNFETYLRDDSGNRRFKPVKVGQLDFEALERDREQLFAEALWLIKSGFENARTLEIEGDAKIYENLIQSEKMVADESALMLEKFMQFFDYETTKESDPKFDFEKFKILDLFDTGSGAGDGSPFIAKPFKNWKFDSRNVQFASKALRFAGAVSWKSHGIKYWKITKRG